MSCCPNAIHIPLVRDCDDAIRNLLWGESLNVNGLVIDGRGGLTLFARDALAEPPHKIFTILDGSKTEAFSIQVSDAGAFNLFMGRRQGDNVTTADSCICIGDGAGRDITSADDCLLIGQDSGRNITDNQNNMHIGTRAGRDSTGQGNFSFGPDSMRGASGSGNFSVGSFSLHNVEGNFNIALGRQAGINMTSATDNILIGDLVARGAEGQLATADDCIIFGKQAYSTGSNVIIIGHDQTAAANEIVFGRPTHESTTLRGQQIVTNNDNGKSRTYVLTRQTTDASNTDLRQADGSTSIMSVPNDSVWTYTARVSAVRDDGSEGAAYTIVGAVRKDGAASVTALGSAGTTTVVGEDDATWDANIVIEGGGSGIVVRVNGAVSKTIEWCATVEITEAQV